MDGIEFAGVKVVGFVVGRDDDRQEWGFDHKEYSSLDWGETELVCGLTFLSGGTNEVDGVWMMDEAIEYQVRKKNDLLVDFGTTETGDFPDRMPKRVTVFGFFFADGDELGSYF